MIKRLRLCLLLFSIGLFFAASSQTAVLTVPGIVDLVNKDRVAAGLSTLTLNPVLNLAAFAKASDMLSKGYFAHISPDGTQPWHWFKALGYNYAYAGENLAAGFTDPSDLESSWMASTSHRANILSPFYSEVGLAVLQDGNTSVVVEFFGSKDNKVTLRE